MTDLEHTSLWVVIKNSSYLMAFLASIEYLGFNPETLGIFTVLMMIDFVTGIARSARVDGCSSITSHGWRYGILKKVLMLVALFTMGLTGKGVGYDLSTLVQACVTVLILSEAYSILGNIHSFRTGKQKNEFDAVSFMLEQVGALLTRSTKRDNI